MFTRPKIKDAHAVHVLGDDYLFVLGEQTQSIYAGKLYAALAPLLDGTRTISEILKAANGAGMTQTYAALNRLALDGHLVEGIQQALPPSERALFEQLGGAAALDAQRAEATVTILALNDASTDGLAEALDELGLNADLCHETATACDAEHLVVLTDDYLRPELAKINRARMASGRSWLLAKIDGFVAWLGPLFVPDVTGCWACAQQRMTANRQVDAYLAAQGVETPLVTTRVKAAGLRRLSARLLALDIGRWLAAGTRTRLAGKLATVDLFKRSTEWHQLVKRPQCPVCGEPTMQREALSPTIPAWQSRPKRYRFDGGHRSETPAETYARLHHHVSPILGAVTELLPAVGANQEITPSVVAGHNFSMGTDSIALLQESLRGLSGGKGCTLVQAQVSGLCEALERYAGLYTGEEPTRRATCEQLGEAAIHPNEYLGFSEEQYAAREEWNAANGTSRCVLVPTPFDTTAEMDWTPLVSLIDGTIRWLPTAQCYYGHPEFQRYRSCPPDSNGTAAGSSIEEAFLQGFYELVERDAAAIWWYNRIPRRGVDLDSFDTPYIQRIREHYETLGRELWVLDITSDLGVPTFACVSRQTQRPTEDLLLGLGTHLDPLIALLRSITEVNQFLPSVNLTWPDGSTRYLFGDDLAKNWWRNAAITKNSYLSQDESLTPLRAADIPVLAKEDMRDDVQTCLDIARRKGIDVMLLDQTRPDLGVSVVKAVAPALCHFWRRLGKRRLYEVPVRAGWLERARRAEELNPWSIFF